MSVFETTYGEWLDMFRECEQAPVTMVGYRTGPVPQDKKHIWNTQVSVPRGDGTPWSTDVYAAVTEYLLTEVPDPPCVCETYVDAADVVPQQSEADRLWDLVVLAAESSRYNK